MSAAQARKAIAVAALAVVQLAAYIIADPQGPPRVGRRRWPHQHGGGLLGPQRPSRPAWSDDQDGRRAGRLDISL